MLTNLPKDEDDPQIGKAIPEALEEILNNVATTGRLSQPWEEVRLLFRWKLCKVLDQYFASCGFIGPITQSYESRKREILFLFDQFTVEPPFTLQRFAEVLQRSWSQYRATHTIMNGVSKLLSVSPGGFEE
eukprot:gene1030-1092_t